MTLDAFTYTITRGAFTKTGTIDVSGAPTLSAIIGGIPAATGYTIALTATSTEGTATFTGSAEFDIIAGETSSVTVHLRGTLSTGNGKVAVNGTINLVPIIDELSASPLEVYVGSSIALSSVSRDPDAWPSRFKLAYSSGSWELFDLVADPLETTNLYDSAPHTAVRASLQAELATLEADATGGYFP